MSDERKPRVYGAWAGSKGTPEDPERCIASTWEPVSRQSYQCSRKRGYGLNGAYCKQHDPDRIEAKRQADDQARAERYAASKENHVVRERDRKIGEYLRIMWADERYAAIVAEHAKQTEGFSHD